MLSKVQNIKYQVINLEKKSLLVITIIFLFDFKRRVYTSLPKQTQEIWNEYLLYKICNRNLQFITSCIIIYHQCRAIKCFVPQLLKSLLYRLIIVTGVFYFRDLRSNLILLKIEILKWLPRF